MPVVLGKSEPGARTKVGTTRDFQRFSEIEIQNISALQNQVGLKSAKPRLSCGSRASEAQPGTVGILDPGPDFYRRVIATNGEAARVGDPGLESGANPT